MFNTYSSDSTIQIICENDSIYVNKYILYYRFIQVQNIMNDVATNDAIHVQIPVDDLIFTFNILDILIIIENSYMLYKFVKVCTYLHLNNDLTKFYFYKYFNKIYTPNTVLKNRSEFGVITQIETIDDINNLITIEKNIKGLYYNGYSDVYSYCYRTRNHEYHDYSIIENTSVKIDSDAALYLNKEFNEKHNEFGYLKIPYSAINFHNLCTNKNGINAIDAVFNMLKQHEIIEISDNVHYSYRVAIIYNDFLIYKYTSGIDSTKNLNEPIRESPVRIYNMDDAHPILCEIISHSSTIKSIFKLNVF